MKFGHFDDQRKEYVITTPATPLPWINYLGNEEFFGLISNTLGGYCFYRDAKLQRLLRYRYNSVPGDTGGRFYYIKEAGKPAWNPGFLPTRTPLDGYRCRHGMGYTVFESGKDSLAARLTCFVPMGENCELHDLTLTNQSGEAKTLQVYGCVEWCLWNAVDDAQNYQRKPYGQILTGYDTAALVSAMEAIPLPEAGVAYEPSIAALEANAIFGHLQNNAYGGMPVQIGMCWGRNTKLNCLEYHRDSEVNIGTGDFILLLAKQDEIVDGKLDTAKVKAFRVPAGVTVEVYATTLHYAPCHVDEAKGFRAAVVLPKGTNDARPQIQPVNEEDRRLWARNKWLLAHSESAEAGQGAYVGLSGVNIDIVDQI